MKDEGGGGRREKGGGRLHNRKKVKKNKKKTKKRQPMKTSGMRNPFVSQYRILLQLKDVSKNQTDRQTDRQTDNHNRRIYQTNGLGILLTIFGLLVFFELCRGGPPELLDFLHYSLSFMLRLSLLTCPSTVHLMYLYQ